MQNQNLTKIAVCCEDQAFLPQASMFAQTSGYPLVMGEVAEVITGSTIVLLFSQAGTSIHNVEGGKARQFQVSFITGARAHRRKYGGGYGQAIAKAVGLPSKIRPLHVLDATAGQGGDAFVLACLGCRVTLVERSLLAKELLKGALLEAERFASKAEDLKLQHILTHMTLVSGDFTLLADTGELGQADIVYLDPMFPARKKKALVKKEMQVFHRLIGPDSDADELLQPALSMATYRVVVKRPAKAPYLAAKEPSFQLQGKSSRFDIYVKRSLKHPSD